MQRYEPTDRNRIQGRVSWASEYKITKPSGLRDTVNAAVAYMDVGEGREQDAEALCTDSSCSYPGRAVQHAISSFQFSATGNKRLGGQNSSPCSSKSDDHRIGDS